MSAIDLKTLLGVAIRNERSAQRISQEELAYRAGLHRTYLSDVERGARNPSIESIAKLAAALQISISQLFEKASNGNVLPRQVEILLIEDNANDVALTLRAFKQAHLTNPVHVLSDGEQALDFFFKGKTLAQPLTGDGSYIILLDLNLPKVSGIEVLTQIKGDKRTRNIPVIILTASNQDKDVIACRRLGCNEYIVKPVGFQNFSQIVPQFSLGWTLVRNGSRRRKNSKLSYSVPSACLP